MSDTRARDRTTYHGKYLSLTSFRRDGTPVATPVWFVEDDKHVRMLLDLALTHVGRAGTQAGR